MIDQVVISLLDGVNWFVLDRLLIFLFKKGKFELFFLLRWIN